MPSPQTKRQYANAEPSISGDTTDTKPQSRYRRFQPLWESTRAVGPILPSPRFAGEGFQCCAGQILAIIALQELICQLSCLPCCSPIAAELGGGGGCVVPMHRPMGSTRGLGSAGLGGGGWGVGTKGLTRGSLLPLSRDLNQTERFCHPSH